MDTQLVTALVLAGISALCAMAYNQGIRLPDYVTIGTSVLCIIAAFAIALTPDPSMNSIGAVGIGFFVTEVILILIIKFNHRIYRTAR